MVKSCDVDASFTLSGDTMKKQFALGLVLLLSISGCGWRKKKHNNNEEVKSKTEFFSEVDIPVAGDAIQSFFDEDVNEFAYVEESKMDESAQAIDIAQAYDDAHGLTWEEVAIQQDLFKTIYFDFDSDRIKSDQEEALAHDIELIKQKIATHEQKSHMGPMTIVVEGHSDDAAGTPAYNFALSERRAKKVKDRMVAAGIPQEYIKIVGRGQEIPAIVDGKRVDGDRYAQWPNRRDEIRIIYA